jgi:exosome complex RNA-binding protein Rrp4
MLYLKLCVARDSTIAQQLADEGYSTLLQHYTMATDASDSSIYEEFTHKGDTVQADIVAVLGDRAYTRQAQIVLRDNGSVWVDAEQEEELFC